MFLMITTLHLAAAAMIELYLKIPLPRTIYLIVMCICLVETFLISKITRQGKYLQMAFLLSLVVMIHLVPWNHRKVFLVAFKQIETGMTESQVKNILADFIDLHNSNPNILTYRPSLASEFDSDFGYIYFDKGRVTRMTFLPD